MMFLLSAEFGRGEEQKILRVLTINAWPGLDHVGTLRLGEYEDEGRRELRFTCLAAQLRALRPDVIFVQGANPVGGFASRLAKALGYDEIHQVYSGGVKIGPVGFPTNWKEGLATLCAPSLRLAKSDVWMLNGSVGLFGDRLMLQLSPSSQALVGKIKVGATPLYLVNVRLVPQPPSESALMADQGPVQGGEGNPPEDPGPRGEWNSLLQCLQTLPKNSPVILAGNFDAAPQSEGMQLLQASASLRLVRPNVSGSAAWTWDPSTNENTAFSTHGTDADGETLSTPAHLRIAELNKRPRWVDHILLSQGFKAEDVFRSVIVLDSAVNGVHVSDHYGMMADVRLSNAFAAAPRESPMVPLPAAPVVEPAPIVAFDPVTGWGLGAAGRFRDLLQMSESLTLLASGSTRGERVAQLSLSAPGADVRRGKLYALAIDVSVDYSLWTDAAYFGLGNSSSRANRENFSRETFGFRVTAEHAFTLCTVGYGGLKYASDRNFRFGGIGRLAKSAPPGSASRIAFASCLLGFRFDSRDNVADPSQGVLAGGEEEYAPSGSETRQFIRLSAHYEDYTVLFYPRTVLALRCAMTGVAGSDLPIQLLTPLGGGATLRGFARERYLDNIAAWINAELRFPLVWRIGGAAGVDAGRVVPALSKLSFARWSHNSVLGLRYVADPLVVRVDVAFSRELTGAYLCLGQFF
jgi:hypothetical protein